jgi:hypothetical protein
MGNRVAKSRPGRLPVASFAVRRLGIEIEPYFAAEARKRYAATVGRPSKSVENVTPIYVKAKSRDQAATVGVSGKLVPQAKAIKEAVGAGDLLPRNTVQSRIRGRQDAIDPAVWDKPWAVFAKSAVQGSDKLLNHLGRCVHRWPLPILQNRQSILGRSLRLRKSAWQF